MTDRLSRLLLPASIVSCCLLAAYLAIFRPGYFSSSDELAFLLFLQVLLVAIWRYRTRFFPVLLAAFLWAAVDLPWNVVWTSGRWFVLAVGALAGLVIYMKERQHHFTKFHLVAFFCVVAAFVSALVSAFPHLALFKAVSLALLFLYGSTGARLVIAGKGERFFAGLLVGCELLVYVSAIAYFVVRVDFFGNPNSLGAVIGVAAAPLILWGILVSEQGSIRWRRTFAFVLALLLLFSSYARAGIAAGAVSCIMLCLALRRYKLLLNGLCLALLLASLVVATVPLPDHPSDSLTSAFVYKGHQEEGILGSRKSVWERTVSVIQEHPWFGSGFGTSLTTADAVQQFGSFESTPQTSREHGNSYLAITEWVGLVGDIPFLLLAMLIAVNVGRAMVHARRTEDALSPAVPIAAVLAAGLVHAAFEDWLFAVGYYLCVFFWTLAFLLVDLLPAKAPALSSNHQSVSAQWPDFSVATFGR